jgi:hypothetical protein
LAVAAQAKRGRAEQEHAECASSPKRLVRDLPVTSFSDRRGFRVVSVEELSDRQERAAKNQSLFREVNERVKDINDHFHALTALSDWVCECANESCSERIELTTCEYDRVRAEGERFFVAPSNEHVWPDAERVVEQHARYWVVEKVELAADIANTLDPRSNGGPIPLQT